jgi:Domain of unknown function (DUF1887)
MSNSKNENKNNNIVIGISSLIASLTLGGTALAVSKGDAIATLGFSALGGSAISTIVSKQKQDELEKKALKESVSQLQNQVISLQEKAEKQPIIPAKETTLITPQIPEIFPIEIEDNSDQVKEWLKARNVTIIAQSQPDELDQSKYKIALFLGKNYAILEEFYQQIKKNMKKKINNQIDPQSMFNYNKLSENQEDINICYQFCQLLRESGFLLTPEPVLTKSKNKEPLIKNIKTAKNEKMSNFINGDWFEYFIEQQIVAYLKANEQEFSYMKNAKLVFGDPQQKTHDNELDLLFLVNKKIIWIECKSGNHYEQFLSKYAELRKQLQFGIGTSFVVILDSENKTNELSLWWKLTVVNPNNLLKKIQEVLDLSKSPQEIITIPEHSEIEIEPNPETEKEPITVREKPVKVEKEEKKPEIPQQICGELILEIPTDVAENNSQAIAYLEKCPLVINYTEKSPEIEKIKIDIAVFLGENYTILKELNKKIKDHIAKKTSGKIDINSPLTFNQLPSLQNEIDICLQYCRFLYQGKILASAPPPNQSKNKAGGDYITIRTLGDSENQDIANFLNTGWVNIFMEYKITELLKANNQNFAMITNAKIKYMDSENNQQTKNLDVILYLEDKLIYIQSYLGNYSRKMLTMYNELKEILKAEKKHSFFVIMNDEQTEHNQKFYQSWHDKIIVVKLDYLLNLLSKNLGLTYYNEPLKINTGISNNQIIEMIKTDDHNPLYTIFRHRSFRPCPENRHQVLKQLVEILGQIDQPVTVNYLEMQILEKISNLSKSKLHEILKAVVYSNCFINGEGEPVISFGQQIEKLISDDVQILEKKCIEKYAEIALSTNPNYFEHPENVNLFEETVGGKYPIL